MQPSNRRSLIASFATGLLLLCPLAKEAQSSEQIDPEIANLTNGSGPSITSQNWGSFGSAVIGTSEPTTGYSTAELFAGPMKFTGSGDTNYFHGVLPNGRIVKPAGDITQVGMNPLGIALTPDGKFAIVSNDDERDGTLTSLQNATNHGGYSLTVLDTSTSPMAIVSQINTQGRLFIGLQVVTASGGGYTLFASGGGDNVIKLFSISATGVIAVNAPATISILPILPANQGWVSNFFPIPTFNFSSIPSPGSSTSVSSFSSGYKTTFPAGSALSPDSKFLYVACNGDNSLAVIDTTTLQVVARDPVGYFPYTVSVSTDGNRIAVSNWGVTAYKFSAPTYDGTNNLTALGTTSGNEGQPNVPAGYFVPEIDTKGNAPKTSSVSIFDIPNGNPTHPKSAGSVNEGKPLDHFFQVGDTHPSATAIVHSSGKEVLYVALTNDDSLGLIDLATGNSLGTFKLPLFNSTGSLVGTYPNALVASKDGSRLYVAEAGINSVAVLDTTNPTSPNLVSRVPTGWWPSGVALSSDDSTLYIINAKGIGEDINSNTVQPPPGAPPATGVESFTDSNFIFGTVQKVLVSTIIPGTTAVRQYNVGQISNPDTSVVPLGGKKGSSKIKTVIFIEQENKAFDSILGSNTQYGNFASTSFNNPDGTVFTSTQYNPVTQNTQLLATTFATAVNYYSNSEESDAGHQFCASGTASDYTEKTLLVKSGRGLLVNKNFEPEDYPASGYIFNNAARNGVSFKDYGELVRIDGTDTGNSVPTTLDDPDSGNMGYPSVPETNPVTEVPNSDVNNPTAGLGQAYFLNLPILAVLGENNKNGESHLDKNYPGYNFNISDQRRALEFIRDFDQMVTNGTVPQFLYIYIPNDHTGGTVATNIAAPVAAQQVEDGDVALGMVVQHIMNSPVYYDADDGTGAAILITYDDAQSTNYHIHPQRTPLIVVSPFAKPAYGGQKHYVTASIVKTEELLLGLPPNNLGDLLATDLRDLFQAMYNGITLQPSQFNRVAKYEATPAGRAVWALVNKLDTAQPDQDSRRLGALSRLSMRADDLYKSAKKDGKLDSDVYRLEQQKLMSIALAIVGGRNANDLDD